MLKLKKSVSLLLAVLLLAIMAIPAFAKSTPKDTANKVTANGASTATVSVATGNDGDVLKAYKVVNATIDAGNQLNFEFTASFKAFLAATPKYSTLTVDDYCDPAKYASDSSALKELLGAFTAYVKANSTAADFESSTVSSGSADFTALTMGQYIIVGSGNNKGAYVYQTVTAEVVPFVENGEYKIYDAYSVTMKNTKPTTDKSIEEGTVKDGTKDTASIGDTVKFKLMGTIPTYPNGATNTTYFLADTLSNGLTLKSEKADFVVKGYPDADETGVVLQLDRDYKITFDGQKIYIDFIYGQIKQYSKVTVEYDVILNENAKVGTAEGNPNDLDLIWSNSPFDGTTYEPGNPDRPNDTNGYGKLSDKEVIYTYALAINKFDKDETSKKLSGVVFEIHKQEDCLDAPIAEITTNANGFAGYTGLKAGVYYLKETKAFAGYKLPSKPVKIEIKENSAAFGTVTKETEIEYTTDKDQAKFPVQALSKDGKALWIEDGGSGVPVTEKDPLKTYKPAYVKSITTKVSEATVNTGTAATGHVVLDIENTKGGFLPSTGGIGTIIFTASGAVLMILAAAAFVVKKSRDKKLAK